MKKPEIKRTPTGQIKFIIGSEQEKWLREVLMDLTGEAQRRAPLDEGTLRASADWEVNGKWGKVYFDSPYAAVQHERLDFKHTDGEAKYLEKPAKEKQAIYAAALAARLRRKLGA